MACLMDLLMREKELVEDCRRIEEHIERTQRELRHNYENLEEVQDKLKQIRGFIKKYFEGECQ